MRDDEAQNSKENVSIYEKELNTKLRLGDPLDREDEMR